MNQASSKFTFIFLGLGNSGSNYNFTRHNIGYTFIDYMNKKHNLEIISASTYSYSIYTCNNPYKPKKNPNNKVIFLKVNSYMNTVGPIFKKIIMNDFKDKTQDFKILCDDLETDIGQVKNSITGGDRGHNGIKSIVSAFGHNNFEKIKFGIGRPESKNPIVVGNYVLSKFSLKELAIIEEQAFAKIEKYINTKC